MILTVCDGAGGVLGQKNIAQSRWTATRRGFVNAQSLAVRMAVAGVPMNYRIETRTGMPLSPLTAFNWPPRQVDEADSVLFPPGRLACVLLDASASSTSISAST